MMTEMHIAVSGTSGTGAAPYRFITYADVLYLKAELIHAGLISGMKDVFTTGNAGIF